MVVWKQAVMLFVNIDHYAGTSRYPNTFPESGRKVVWFPSPGQSQKHPVIRRMLALPVQVQTLQNIITHIHNLSISYFYVRPQRNCIWLQ